MRRVAPWGAALIGAAVLFALFQPGYFSFDSAHQWWMVRGGQWDSTHPMAMVLAWTASAAVLPDPQGFFALQLLLVWGGLACIARALPLRPWAQALVVLVLGAWPSFAAVQVHVWKDVWMVGALLWAVGALLHEQRAPALRWRALAFLALAFAAALRFNALPGIAPLALWLAWRVWTVPTVAGPAWLARVDLRRALAVLSFPLLLVLAMLPDRLPGVRQVTVWPIVALWDLAAVSIDTGRPQLPPAFLKPGAGIADLARDFRPEVNVPSFATGTIRFHYELEVPASEMRALREAWLALPLREPQAWAAHRLRLSSYLFGFRPAELPDGAVLMPGLMPYLDNPPLALAPSPLRERLQAFWSARVDGPFFMGVLYVLVSLVAAAVAWRRRRLPALAVAASGLGMAAPLVLIAPAADFRYLLWTVVAALVASLLALLPSERPAA